MRGSWGLALGEVSLTGGHSVRAMVWPFCVLEVEMVGHACPSPRSPSTFCRWSPSRCHSGPSETLRRPLMTIFQPATAYWPAADRRLLLASFRMLWAVHTRLHSPRTSAMRHEDRSFDLEVPVKCSVVLLIKALDFGHLCRQQVISGECWAASLAILWSQLDAKNSHEIFN